MLNVEHRQVRSSILPRKYLHIHVLEYLQPVRAKFGPFFFSPPLGKSQNTREDFEGLSLVDTRFAPRDSPRPLKKQMAMSPSSIGHGQHGTRYSPFGWILRAAFTGEIFFVFFVNQPVFGRRYLVSSKIPFGMS